MKCIALIVSLLLFQTGFTQTYYLLCGTYTKPSSKGIYVYTFDAKTGNATLISTTYTDSPSYFAMNEKTNHLYSVNERRGGLGAVSNFLFDRKSGNLKFVNKALTHGDDPCYIQLDKQNKWAAVANYSSGSLSVLPVKTDGSIGEPAQVIRHTGTGPNKDRQEQAHVHSTVFSPDGKYLTVADLGTDEITVYPFDASSEKPVTDEPVVLPSMPGSGPRHIIFHPTKQFAYVIEEMSGNIVAYRYNDEGADSIQIISSYPADFSGERGSAAIRFSPDGKFLYGSNRAASNTISIFSVDEQTGKLTSLGFQSTGGENPRDFTIDPSGKFLLVGNMSSNNILILNRDLRTGMLKNSGKKISIPRPTNLLFTHIN